MSDGSIKALLVDDEPEFVNLVKFFLERDHSISVDPANSVKDALEVLEASDHDAIISDYQMPDIDGVEFLKIVRAKGSNIPFILLTGKGREDVAVEALNLGADFYIQKHGDLKAMHAELANAIRQSVEKRDAVESLRKSEKTYRDLVELAKEGIWVLNTEGVTTFVNQSMAEMLGRSRDEMLGKPFYDFMADSLKMKASEYLARRVSGVSEGHEFDFIKNDGTALRAFLATCPVRDDHDVVVGAMAVVSDISDRVRAETLLRKERDLAKQYLDVAGVIILGIGVDGRVTLVNRRGCEVLGYKEGEILGQDWFDNFLPERDRAEVRMIFQEVLEGRITHENPVTRSILTQSGEERIIRWRNTVIRDDDGNVIQTLSSGEDVTELKLHERRLQRELDESAAFAELSTLLISPTLSIVELSKIVLRSALALTDSEHGFVSSADPVTKSITCHTATEMATGGLCGITGQEPPTVFPIGEDGRYPSLWGVPLNTMKPFYSNSPGEHESSSGLSEGHVLLSNFLSVPVLYGDELVGQISVANACRDYDDDDVRIAVRLAEIFAVALRRERDLATLVAMQNRFEAFMDQVSAVTYMKGTDRKYIFANRGYEELLGIAEAEIVGKTDDELWPEDTAKQFSTNDNAVLSAGKPGRFVEYVTVHGEVREYLSHKFLVMDFAGKPALLGGVSIDITDMRRVEEALQRANEKLQLLGHLTRHDALNQASVLKGWLSLSMKAASVEEVKEHLEKMTSAIEDLTRQLEFASEYEKIGMDIQVWMGVEDVCREVLSDMDVSGVTVDCHCENVELLVDPTFYTVMRNLVDNTLRHSGGAKRVEIRCEVLAEGMNLVYTDDGKGIPVAVKEKVFERGFGSNTGLGLYLVREVLRASGMTIRETGVPGQGARFEILVPEGRYRAERE